MRSPTQPAYIYSFSPHTTSSLSPKDLTHPEAELGVDRAWPHSFQGSIFLLGAFHSPGRSANRGPIHVLVFPSTAISALETSGARPFYFLGLSCQGRRGTPGSSSGQKQSTALLGHIIFCISFHYLWASPAAQVPDTVGNFLRCISKKTVSTFPNKEQSHRSGQHLFLKASWEKTASFSRHQPPLVNQERSSCGRTNE